MIKQLNNFPENVVAFVCAEHVTKADYETVLVPAVEEMFRHHRKGRLFYETAPTFKGMDAGAMWEDFKEAVAHFTSWERVALVTDVDWIKNTVKLSAFLTPAEVKIFPTSQAAQAREWVTAAKPVASTN